MNITINLTALLPAIIALVAALVVLAADIVLPQARGLHLGLALAALTGVAVSAVVVHALAGGSALADTVCTRQGSCWWEVGPVVGTLQVSAALAALVVILLSAPALLATERDDVAARVALILTATGGAAGVAASRDAASWLISLELATVPLIILVALPATRRAIAGAIQLLTTSLVSFAMLVLAVACWYAATGSAILSTEATLAAGSGSQKALLSLAVVLFLAGLGFKLSLVPFHAWTPTAYAGAPVPVAAFLAATSKIAALGALLVVLRAVASLGGGGLIAVAALAIGSMTMGNIIALRQEGAVRLLAWSTVAQAGWVVLPLLSPSSLGVRGAATYLLAYVVATLVAFSVVTLVSEEALPALRPQDGPADPYEKHVPAGRPLTAYAGLLRRHPLAGIALILALTSLAGLPPGLIGLVGKVVALQPLVAEGWWILGVLAAVNAVLGVAVYLRWLRIIIAPSPVGAPGMPGGAGSTPHLAPSGSVRFAIALTTVLLVALSALPQLLLGALN